MQHRPAEKSYQAIFDVTYLYWLSQGIYTLTKLNIASLLKKGSFSAIELSEKLKVHYPNIDSDNLYRVMRNLSAIGLFEIDVNSKFTLTSVGDQLLNENVREIILDVGGDGWNKIANLGVNDNFDNFNEIFHKDYTAMPKILRDIFFAFQYSKALYLFVKLGLVDILSASTAPLSTTDIASRLGIGSDIANTLCSLMCDKGITVRNDADLYSLSDIGKALIKYHPRSLRNVPLHENTAKWLAASNLLAAVTEGNEPFHLTHGEGLFDYLKKLENSDKQEFEIFNNAMAEISRIEIDAISHNLSIPTGTKTVIDVGGGTGALIIALLGEHPELRGIIFDLPETVHNITNIDSRCKAIGGSFFDKETIPEADLILLKRALHDWPDDKAVEILRNCSEKCKDLRVIEWLWKDTPFVASLDLFLMSIGGKIRSEQDFRQLLDSANIPCAGITELTPGVFAVNGKPNRVTTTHAEASRQNPSQAMRAHSGIYSEVIDEDKVNDSKPDQSQSGPVIK